MKIYLVWKNRNDRVTGHDRRSWYFGGRYIRMDRATSRPRSHALRVIALAWASINSNNMWGIKCQEI